MPKKKQSKKKPERTASIQLALETRIVQVAPAMFVLVEKMLKFVVVNVPGKVAVVPILDRDGETGCYLYPAGTQPLEAMQKTVDALWNKGISWFLKRSAKK